MKVQRFSTKATALVLISFAIVACQTPPRAIRPGSEIDPGTGYVAMRFRGPDAAVSLVELTEREQEPVQSGSANACHFATPTVPRQPAFAPFWCRDWAPPHRSQIDVPDL